jgi:hypothetical protein
MSPANIQSRANLKNTSSTDRARYELYGYCDRDKDVGKLTRVRALTRLTYPSLSTVEKTSVLEVSGVGRFTHPSHLTSF